MRTMVLLEFCVNYDLRWYLREYEKCNWDVKTRWATQSAHGLMEIHRVGMTHGDLRSENVVLDDHLNSNIINVG